MTDIGLIGWGIDTPQKVLDYRAIAQRSGIPPEVIRDKFGINRLYEAGPDDQASQMSERAARRALEVAGLTPANLDLIVYHGSEYKDHIVWNAATKIQQRLGAVNAYAFEVYSLCAGAGVALNMVGPMMQADPGLRNVLLVAASREGDLLDYTNQRGRFMFNFGAGAGALILRRDHPVNRLMGTAVITDPTLADTVVMPAGGSLHPPSERTLRENMHVLDVPDVDYMRDRLGEVSLPNFIEVIRRAVEKGGFTLRDIGFLGITHMKPSFHAEILDRLGLRPEQAVYLSDYGHIQSADQAIALYEGLRQGKIKDGDLVVLAGAGTGYTWSAAAFKWGVG